MEDEKIIELYFSRNETAITETKNKYKNYLCYIANNILHNFQDTEECENDTYTAAWHSIPPNRPLKLQLFLGRLIRNIALNKWDFNTAKKRNSGFDLILSELEDCIASRSNVENEVDEHELSLAISSFLHDTDEISRKIFIRRYWYSDSISEICFSLSISKSKAKSILFRTRNKLREYLIGEGFTI